MRTTSRVGAGPVHTTEGIMQRPADQTLSVPLVDLDNESGEGIALGFRQTLFTLVGDGREVASVASTGGYGGVAMLIRFRDREVMIDTRRILVNWVEQFDPPEAEKLRKAVGL